MCVSCAETGTDCYILTPSSSDHSSTSFSFCLGCSTVGHWRPKPSVWSWYSLRWHPISNWLKPSVSWLYFCLTPTCFRLFTQVHFLIGGSVEGQYVTNPLKTRNTFNSSSIKPNLKDPISLLIIILQNKCSLQIHTLISGVSLE